MQSIDGRPVHAATDLVAYLACEHLTSSNAPRWPVSSNGRCAPIRSSTSSANADSSTRPATSPTSRPMAGTPRRSSSTARSRTTATALRAAATATIDAMAPGADVIYQATFFDGTWRGHADFLLRVDDPARPSVWGPYHYEVADTKLARHVKASAVLQICSYIDQLERIQGVRPEWLYVALGGGAGPSIGFASTTTWRTTGASGSLLASGHGRPRGRLSSDRDVPGAGRSLRRLSLGSRMHCPAQGR